MDLTVKVIGQTDEQLKAALECVYTMFYNKDIKYWGILSDENGHPHGDKMCFNVAKTDTCQNELPCIYDADMVVAACKPWLDKFKALEGWGDGSYVKGWTVELADWADDYKFSVKFTTLYFGK